MFQYDEHYPCGGFHDYVGSFDTKEEIFSLCKKGRAKFKNYEVKFNGSKNSFEFFQIVDTQNGYEFEDYGWNEIEKELNLIEGGCPFCYANKKYVVETEDVVDGCGVLINKKCTKCKKSWQ